MKQRKKKENKQNENIRQWRKSFMLGKRREAHRLRRENTELERREIFEKKTASASDRRAPVTLRTKAYYRFAKEYPSAVDANGFRDNSPGRKTVLRRRIVTVLLCVFVFAASFVAAKTCVYLSRRPVLSSLPPQTEKTDLSFRALHFSYDDLRAGDVAAMKSRLDEYGCTAAVFEFKDDDGYVLFNIGSFLGTSADKRISDAMQTVNSLKTAGYEVCAYISCFKDSAAAVADLTYSVRKNTYEGAAWTDNAGNCWLDPFSPAARDYVLNVVAKAAEDGFDRILLSNVCFSTDSGSAQPCWAWENESSMTRNQALVSFIGSAVKCSGKAKLTFMGSTAAFEPSLTVETPGYFGGMLSSAASSVCVDARLSCQPKNTVIGGETFSDASLMPYVFVLAASEYGVDAVKDSEKKPSETLVCVENGDNLSEELDAVRFSGADGCIIW